MYDPSERNDTKSSSASPSTTPPRSVYDQAVTSPSNAGATPPSDSLSSSRPSPPSAAWLIPLDQIDADHERNDRITLPADELDQLANSIRAHGMINPVRLRTKADRFEMVAGFRRLEAARLIGMSAIPATIVNRTHEQDPGTRLAENLVRSNLSPVEEARAVDRVVNETSDQPEQVATRLNRTTAWVRHRIALAHYPDQILEALHIRSISIAVADELAAVTDAAVRDSFLDAAVRNGVNAATARLWRMHANAGSADPSTHNTQPPGPQHVGPPPTMLKECFGCGVPTDVTQLSYVTFCGPCIEHLGQATKTAAGQS